MEEKNAFTITPMNQMISLEPGQIYEGSIEVSNPSRATEDFAYKITVSPYSIVDEDYNIDLLNESDRTAIAKWITVEDSTGTIKPNEVKTIKYTIKVPDNVPAGGQYAALSVSSNFPSDTKESYAVQDVFELSSIIYANIAGETVQGGEVTESDFPSFITSLPLETSALITNTGNIHEIAKYSITVRDFFTGNIVSVVPDVDSTISETIMPESTHRLKGQVDHLPALGVVKVTQTINYNGQDYVTEHDVVICPVWFMILASITLIAIISTVVHLVRKHRHNRMIH